MSMLKIPYFYPLLDDFDKNFFALLRKAIDLRYEFVGNSDDRIFFVKSLLVFQMLKDYRAPLYAVKEELAQKTNLERINAQLRKSNFVIDYSWAVWGRDKEIGHLAEKFLKSSPKIIGSNEEFNEFVLRYLVSIWLVDWEGPLYVLLQTTSNGAVNLKELNELLALWDFTNIFTTYKKG